MSNFESIELVAMGSIYNVNKKYEFGSMLEYAAAQGKLSIVNYLIHHNAEIKLGALESSIEFYIRNPQKPEILDILLSKKWNNTPLKKLLNDDLINQIKASDNDFLKQKI